MIIRPKNKRQSTSTTLFEVQKSIYILSSKVNINKVKSITKEAILIECNGKAEERKLLILLEINE